MFVYRLSLQSLAYRLIRRKIGKVSILLFLTIEIREHRFIFLIARRADLALLIVKHIVDLVIVLKGHEESGKSRSSCIGFNLHKLIAVACTSFIVAHSTTRKKLNIRRDSLRRPGRDMMPFAKVGKIFTELGFRNRAWSRNTCR